MTKFISGTREFKKTNEAEFLTKSGHKNDGEFMSYGRAARSLSDIVHYQCAAK